MNVAGKNYGENSRSVPCLAGCGVEDKTPFSHRMAALFEYLGRNTYFVV